MSSRRSFFRSLTRRPVTRRERAERELRRYVVRASEARGLDRIYMTVEVVEALEAFRDFLYDRVYLTDIVTQDFDRAAGILNFLWDYFMADEERFRVEFDPGPSDEVHHQRVTDYITGMTDRFAIRLYEHLFMPRAWSIF